MDSEVRKRDIFVGRQQEMASLTAALDDTLSGRGQMVMLAGEQASARLAWPRS